MRHSVFCNILILECNDLLEDLADIHYHYHLLETKCDSDCYVHQSVLSKVTFYILSFKATLFSGLHSFRALQQADWSIGLSVDLVWLDKADTGIYRQPSGLPQKPHPTPTTTPYPTLCYWCFHYIAIHCTVPTNVCCFYCNLNKNT